MSLYLRVWNISHCSMSQKDRNQRSVARNAHDKNYCKHHGDNVRFWSALVRRILMICAIDSLQGPIDDSGYVLHVRTRARRAQHQVLIYLHDDAAFDTFPVVTVHHHHRSLVIDFTLIF